MAGSEDYFWCTLICCGVFSKYQKYVVISRLEIVHPNAVGKEDKDEQMCKGVPRSQFGSPDKGLG